ncbi:hypothetical protein [Rhodoferax sp.]|uniref:hypothetical protein n=1 Tax=Rhodoferax sp. TaxID=50421 RepID=UPI00285296CB|nr:hypothetical protein [Rhodoferax sp.]
MTTSDEQPLLRVLVWEATRRGETLATLAKQLGVTYERLAQWRRNEGLICNAHRDVHERAARYLGWPTVLVLTMAGTVGLQDFVWPGQGSLDARVARELGRLRQDPFLGGFVPAELAVAAPAVKLFVIFLTHELAGAAGRENQSYHWLRAMQLAAAGHAEAQAEMDTLRAMDNNAPGIF